MHFIYNNIPVFILVLVSALMAWIYGGTRAELLVPVVPWLLLFLVQILFFFPQPFSGESLSEARERVWSALRRDRLVFVVFGFLILLAIPFVNNGLCPICDRELIATGVSPEPPVPFLPYCVNRIQHFNVFLWFTTALLTMLCVKHCLRRSGKRRFLEFLVWNGTVLALLGFIQMVTEAEGPLWQPFVNVDKGGTFFSTFGYPNMAGDYFTVLFGIALALWRRRDSEIREEVKAKGRISKKPAYVIWGRRLYLLIPALILFLAAVNTLSRAAIILATGVLALNFLHAFISFSHHMNRADRVRRGVIALGITAAVVLFAVNSLPEEMQREVDTLNAEEVLTRVTGKGQYHARVATDIWKDNFLFGCGGWGYKHFCIPKMLETSSVQEVKKELQMVGGINVHNDYLQFLAEHGLVGFGLLLVIFLLLLTPVIVSWRNSIDGIRFIKNDRLPAKPVQLFVFPAPAFCILLTVFATIAHGFGDCPLRSPAVLTLFFASLAAITGFLPKTEEEEDAEPVHHHHHHHHHHH